MSKRRISISEIALGKPLRWDVYDGAERLLLTKGFVVEREEQVLSLLERGSVEYSELEKGLFIKSAPPAPPASNSRRVEEKEPPSALRLINQANQRLGTLLFNLVEEPDAKTKILDIVNMLSLATDINRDVALACILLNQEGDYAVRHCIDTSIVSMLVARSMGKPLEDITSLMAAALTMNIAMLELQQELQRRKSGLTPLETETIKRHPRKGVNMLRHVGVTDPVWLTCVLEHHENEDGSGYPNGKKGDEISEYAKILAVADRYCARVSARDYRKSLLPNAALRDMLLVDKNAIDTSLATIFIREFGTYPTGTFVRLDSGEIGVVTGRGATTTTPIVHALVGVRGEPLAFPIKRDTSVKTHSIAEVLYEEQAAIRFSMQQLWGESAKL